MIRSTMTAVALATLAFNSQANTVTISQMLDASAVISGYGLSAHSGTPFTLAAGDTFILNISFLPGQALEVVNPVVLGMQASATDSQSFFSTQTFNSMTFVGLQGSAHDPLAANDHTDGAAVMNFFSASQMLNDGADMISFTGLQFSTTVLSYSDSAADRSFSNVYLFASGASVSAISAVPEPASYLFLVAGLVTVGTVSRRLRG